MAPSYIGLRYVMEQAEKLSAELRQELELAHQQASRDTAHG